MNIVLDFGKFRLELGTHAPGGENPPLWLYNNKFNDGLEVLTDEIDALLEKYYAENM